VFTHNTDGLPSELRGGMGPLWETVSQGQPFPVADERENLIFPDDFRVQKLGKTTPTLWLPLVRDAEPVGILMVARDPAEHTFDSADLQSLREIANHAAVFLRNCRLFEQRQQERRDLDKSLENLSLLYNIGRALNLITNINSLLLYILEQAIEIAKADKGSIMIFNRDTGLLDVRVIHGLPDEALQEKINNNEAECRRFRPGEGIAGKVFETGVPMIVNKTKEDPEFIGGESSYVSSIACIPMVVYDEVLGVINLTNKRDRSGFASDLDLLKAVADQAAVAYNKHQLWDMSITDSLTGLYDRRYFKIRLMDEFQRAERYNKTLSIAMSDLDHFKMINDTFGHAVGDQFLVAIGRYMQMNVRNVDIVARYGGEEFIMFFPETDKNTALSLSERLREGVADIELPPYPQTTISFGVVSYPDDGEDMEDLIHKADMAMYMAKQAGRNRSVTYSDDIDKQLRT